MTDIEALHARIERLEAAGAGRVDPARMAQLRALARRLGDQRDEVRAVLHARMEAAIDALDVRVAQVAPVPQVVQPANVPKAPEFPQVAQVAQPANVPHAAQAAQPASAEAAVPAPAPVRARRTRTPPPPPSHPVLPRSPATSGEPAELASVIRFRRTWSSDRAQERVAAAAARKPANAGPLNSHMLVVQALDMMRELPGDYLRRFLVHVESLQWLEAAQATAQATASRKPKRARPARS